MDLSSKLTKFLLIFSVMSKPRCVFCESHFFFFFFFLNLDYLHPCLPADGLLLLHCLCWRIAAFRAASPPPVDQWNSINISFYKSSRHVRSRTSRRRAQFTLTLVNRTVVCRYTENRGRFKNQGLVVLRCNTFYINDSLI